ncbi:MAG: tetratricopeptide repeat protein, partial [Pseudomonadota bacterium]
MTAVLKKYISYSGQFRFILALIMFLCLPCQAWANPAPKKQVPPGDLKGDQPKLQTLTGVSLGTLAEYSRLIFKFSQPLQEYALSRIDVDEYQLDFGPAGAEGEGRLDLSDALVQGVAVSRTDNHLVIRIKINQLRSKLRHFLTEDRTAVVVDLRPAADRPFYPPEKKPVGELKVESLPSLARALLEKYPARPESGSDTAVLVSALEKIAKSDFNAAVIDLENLKAGFPNSRLLDPGLFLLAEAFYHRGGGRSGATFIKINTLFTEAISRYPDSPLAPRAGFLQARAFMDLEYFTESIGSLKLVAKEYPESPYAVMALISLGDLYLKLDKLTLAKAAFDEAAARGPSGDMFLEAYSRLGQAHFKAGLYSQAIEIFKDILKRVPEFYVKHPEILYSLGEAYYHLHRNDLSRAYLAHVINMNPKMESADMIMARIGDTYKNQDRAEEAIKMYTLTRELYPDSTGALISLIRLAEYGALRRIFQPDSIFMELEDGVEETELKVYKKIIESAGDTPLAHLAAFRVGMTYYQREEYLQALAAFRDILTKHPNSELAADTRDILAKALLIEIKKLFAQASYPELIQLGTENKNLIDQNLWPEIRHYL